MSSSNQKRALRIVAKIVKLALTRAAGSLHWVQTLDDEKLEGGGGGGGLGVNGFGGIQQISHVVVNRLLKRLALLQGLHLLVHGIRVVSLGVQRSLGLLLATIPVKEVVVVQANHGGGVPNQRAGVRVAIPRGRRNASEHGRQPPHERRLPAPGVRSHSNDHRLPTSSFANHHGPWGTALRRHRSLQRRDVAHTDKLWPWKADVNCTGREEGIGKCLMLWMMNSSERDTVPLYEALREGGPKKDLTVIGMLCTRIKLVFVGEI
uniref:Uncharacterized protein n=1 Tax=Physcomitrium patens TaxID=3218 RepID=A0A2K1ISS5_PHYPA|nr:hypothetical protein PHYPA_026451 [Physcomitrium patens]